MLPKTNTVFNVLPTRKLKTIFYWQNISYNKNLVLQCKIIQHSSNDNKNLVLQCKIIQHSSNDTVQY